MARVHAAAVRPAEELVLRHPELAGPPQLAVEQHRGALAELPGKPGQVEQTGDESGRSRRTRAPRPRLRRRSRMGSTRGAAHHDGDGGLLPHHQGRPQGAVAAVAVGVRQVSIRSALVSIPEPSRAFPGAPLRAHGARRAGSGADRAAAPARPVRRRSARFVEAKLWVLVTRRTGATTRRALLLAAYPFACFLFNAVYRVAVPALSIVRRVYHFDSGPMDLGAAIRPGSWASRGRTDVFLCPDPLLAILQLLRVTERPSGIHRAEPESRWHSRRARCPARHAAVHGIPVFSHGCLVRLVAEARSMGPQMGEPA